MQFLSFARTCRFFTAFGICPGLGEQTYVFIEYFQTRIVQAMRLCYLYFAFISVSQQKTNFSAIPWCRPVSSMCHCDMVVWSRQILMEEKAVRIKP